MNIRLRYHGKTRITPGHHFKLYPDRVYYFELKQRGIAIELHKADVDEVIQYPSLKQFLDDWRILEIKKELKHARL